MLKQQETRRVIDGEHCEQIRVNREDEKFVIKS